MAVLEQHLTHLRQFCDQTDFVHRGWIITDLDGTAVHEWKGKVQIPQEVEHGLKRLYDLGRPVVINTLRFPLSVMRTFGSEWYSISNAPIPTVLLNGSQLGYLSQKGATQFGYQEIMAFPLQPGEIQAVVSRVRDLIERGVEDALVFYYPRDWTQGEQIWTPTRQKIPEAACKYLSASRVYTSPLDQLEAQLLSQDICMIYLQVDLPQDQLMAYQHAKKQNFFTHQGVDKLSGAKKIAEYLGVELQNALGAGDTEMDTFLKEVGLPVVVGGNRLSFAPQMQPSVHLPRSEDLGNLLFRLADLHRGRAHVQAKSTASS